MAGRMVEPYTHIRFVRLPVYMRDWKSLEGVESLFPSPENCQAEDGAARHVLLRLWRGFAGHLRLSRLGHWRPQGLRIIATVRNGQCMDVTKLPRKMPAQKRFVRWSTRVRRLRRPE